MNISKLGDLSGMTTEGKVSAIENYLRVLGDELDYILTHLDSNNVIEIDIAKTKLYKGEENEL